jgi:hypothetical protein
MGTNSNRRGEELAFRAGDAALIVRLSSRLLAVILLGWDWIGIAYGVLHPEFPDRDGR